MEQVETQRQTESQRGHLVARCHMPKHKGSRDAKTRKTRVKREAHCMIPGCKEKRTQISDKDAKNANEAIGLKNVKALGFGGPGNPLPNVSKDNNNPVNSL
ncbi:hypothetical protein ACLKA6_007127 [Drosophila palustris]